jgi:hypothetical protein
MQRDRSATAPAPAPAPAIWGANSTCRQSDCNCQRPPRVPATHALIEMTLSRSENGRKATANDIHPPSFDCWGMSETTAQLPLFDSHRSATVRHPFGQYTDDCLVMNAARALEPAFAPLSTLAHTSCLSSAIMGKLWFSHFARRRRKRRGPRGAAQHAGVWTPHAQAGARKRPSAHTRATPSNLDMAGCASDPPQRHPHVQTQSGLSH